MSGDNALRNPRTARSPAVPSRTVIGAMPLAEWSPWRIGTRVYRRPSGPGLRPSMLLDIMHVLTCRTSSGAGYAWGLFNRRRRAAI